MGSITHADGYAFAETPAYKISKAALNMLNKQYAMIFGKEGLTFVCISPGVRELSKLTQKLLTLI